VADAVFYIFDGKVRLTVVSSTGKEATLGIVNVGNFVGEGCLTRQPVRMCSATAIPPCKLLCIDKKAMMFALHREHALSDTFVAYLLTRNIRYGEDLVDPVDQLFNSSKKLWLAFFSCWLASVRKAYRRLESNKSVRKLWQRWWVQLAGE
jgi:hypothetical protein